jgi:hypothetical protein
MTVVRGVTPGTTTAPGRSAKAAGGFRLPGGAGAAKEAGATGGIAAAGGAGLLALQESDSPEQRNDRGRRRARAMLETLESLQLAMLDGSADSATLARLAALTEGEAPADPALAEIVGEVALRARIELARRGQVSQD